MGKRTQREEATALVRAIDDASTPRAPFRKLHDLLKAWDKDRFPGTQVCLERLCRAEEEYSKALEDAKYILEIK